MRHRSFWDSEGPPGLCPSSIILEQPLSLDTLCAPTASFPTLCQTPPAAWHHGSCYSPLHGVPLSQPGRILWEPLKGTEWPGGRCPASSYAQNQPAWCCRDCSAGPLAGLVPGRRAGPGPPGAACSRTSGFQFSAPHPQRAGPRWQRGRSWFSALSFLPRRTKDSNARPPSRNGDSLGRDSLEGRRREGLCEKCPSALDVFSDPLFTEASLSSCFLEIYMGEE